MLTHSSERQIVQTNSSPNEFASDRHTLELLLLANDRRDKRTYAAHFVSRVWSYALTSIAYKDSDTTHDY